MNKGNLERVQTLLSNHKFDEAIQFITSLKIKAANNAARAAAVERSRAEAEELRKKRAETKAQANANAAAAAAKANANAKARANSQLANNAARAAAVERSRAEANALRAKKASAKAKANANAVAASMNPLNKELDNLFKNTNSKIKNNLSANNLNAILQNFMAKGINLSSRRGGAAKFNAEIYKKAVDLIISLQELSRSKREKSALNAYEAATGITNNLKSKYNSLRSAALNNSGANSPAVLQRRLAMLLYTYYKRGYHTKKPLGQNLENALNRKMSRWRSINWTQTSKYT